jgi:hypothetical protein
MNTQTLIQKRDDFLKSYSELDGKLAKALTQNTRATSDAVKEIAIEKVTAGVILDTLNAEIKAAQRRDIQATISELEARAAQVHEKATAARQKAYAADDVFAKEWAWRGAKNGDEVKQRAAAQALSMDAHAEADEFSRQHEVLRDVIKQHQADLEALR